MGFILLGLFAIGEIALLVLTFTGHREKREWLRNRVFVRTGEMLLFLLMLLLPQAAWDFRFRICFYVLLIRIGTASVVWLIRGRKTSGNKSAAGAVVNALVGVIVLAFALVPSFLFTGYAGLETTGEYPVKKASAILVDESRTETFETDGSKREIPVYFYYPETEAAEENSFPLVVFSHGAFGYYQSNTSTYMELASHGYVVVSLDHPYHSFFTEDTDGKLITVNPDFLQEVATVNEEGTADEDILELSHKWLDIREADIHFVLDSVEKAKEDGECGAEWFVRQEETEQEISDILAMTDTAKIGLMGHSLGGAASVSVGRERSDIDAVIDLDGTMLGEQLGYENGICQYYDEAYPVPLLSVDNEEHYRDGQTSGVLYVNNVVLEHAVDGSHTYFIGSGHMNFTDLPLFSPILASLLGTGTVDETECIKTMNRIVLEYFNCYLKGEGQAEIKESY